MIFMVKIVNVLGVIAFLYPQLREVGRKGHSVGELPLTRSLPTAIKGREPAGLSFNSVCPDKNLFSRPHQCYFIIEKCVHVFRVAS